ncbi:MAG: hypothetical protein COA42_13175 [Alteromonadaceae bacterium]|nr:MAG: hypothetical protein COA42_13175 [Alteromonadaceae bacterium]
MPNFNVIILNNIKDGLTPEEVEQRLITLLKVKAPQVKTIMARQRTLVKKGVDQVTAGKYQAAIERCGIACELELIEPPVTDTPASTSSSKPSPKPSLKTSTPEPASINAYTGHWYNKYSDQGAINVWFILAITILPMAVLIGLVSAIAMPAYQDYKHRSEAATVLIQLKEHDSKTALQSPVTKKYIDSKDSRARIKVPLSWKVGAAENEEASINVGNLELETYAILIEDDISLHDYNHTLKSYSEAIIVEYQKVLEEAVVIDTKPLESNGVKGLGYDLSAKMQGFELNYIIAFYAFPGRIYQIHSWTIKANYEQNEAAMRDLVGSLEVAY